MRRLNEKDLDTRIHKFLDRKLAQFPELGPASSRIAREWNDEDHASYTNKKPAVRWSLQLS
ncbi:MAG TPA: hypothetical protein VLF43_02980 [Candidatus Saccharimonadales bacterium]|nr:hypothetical protein [Candidatus Saccharimonadales bacterium]